MISNDRPFTRPDHPEPRDPAPDLEPELQARLDRYEARPAAGESFRHLVTCPGIEFCVCPPGFVDVQGTGRVIA